MAIQRELFLRKAGVDTGADEAFLLNPPNRAELLQTVIENVIRFVSCATFIENRFCMTFSCSIFLPVYCCFF